MKKFYLTTAIDYVNGPPHIGHAYEKIASDVIVRHFRQRGYEVFFLTGVDEHGIKIEKTAAAKDMTPQQYCDEISAKFKETWDKLDIFYDRFIRTTDEDHKKVVQHIFKTLLEKGDIYKASYTGLYCNGCECFVSPKDLTEDGCCPDHKTKPQEVQEENYFFALTKYKQRLEEHIKNNPDFIQPEFRKNELLNQLKDTEDISVSRSKASVSWGIPVPDDDEQVIYVWIDALSNYLTGAGYLSDEEKFNKFWPADVHMIGKDILKFHAIYWPTILMAMDLPLPKTIFAHGWITVEDTKMSKSLGNVISPIDIMNEYNLPNSDAVRYFLMTTAIFGSDGNYSDEEFKAKVNADLANNLGNLLNRTLNMLVKYFDGEIIPGVITDLTYVNNWHGTMIQYCQTTIANVCSNMGRYSDKNPAFEDYCYPKNNVTNVINIAHSNKDVYNLTKAINAIFELVNLANKYVNDQTPWSLMRDPTEENKIKCAQVLYDVLEILRLTSMMLYPVIPSISQDIWKQLGLEGKVENQKWEALAWGGLKVGKIASKDTISPVFLRLDSELAGDAKKSIKS